MGSLLARVCGHVCTDVLACTRGEPWLAVSIEATDCAAFLSESGLENLSSAEYP